MGKHKPIYDPSTDCGDYVVAIGCHDLRTTGKKRFQKKYYTHTTRPGSLRSMTMDKMFEKWGGGEVLRRAVRGMLPKNRLREKRLARLKSMSIPGDLRTRIHRLDADGCSFRGRGPPLQGKHHQVWESIGHRRDARGAAGV
jgi:large subunit ribosomal protein L13